ncbi:putative uncharacterized protein [Bacteroides sp. CAG:875]|jgi:hypothetical protein|nr:putative uncharacterized protein [Bacteroides sp. CAG:875]
MNSIQRYMVLNTFLLGVIPAMGQQKEEKEIKLNEEAIKHIQFDFLPENMEHYNKPLEAPLEKKWMEVDNPFERGIPRSLTDTFMVRKPKGYIRMCPYSIWTKRGEDPVYDVTMEGRPPELIMNESPDLSKKIQTDYGHTLRPSPGRMYDMLNNSAPIEVGKIFKKYIRPIFKKDKK